MKKEAKELKDKVVGKAKNEAKDLLASDKVQKLQDKALEKALDTAEDAMDIGKQVKKQAEKLGDIVTLYENDEDEVVEEDSEELALFINIKKQKEKIKAAVKKELKEIQEKLTEETKDFLESEKGQQLKAELINKLTEQATKELTKQIQQQIEQQTEKFLGDDDKKAEITETENGTVIVENYYDIPSEDEILPIEDEVVETTTVDEPVFVDKETLALVNDYLVE